MKIAMTFLILALTPMIGFAVGSGASSSASTGSAGSADTMTADDHYNIGVALSDSGKYTEALPEFQRAVALRPDFAEAHNMLGFSYRKLGKIKRPSNSGPSSRRPRSSGKRSSLT